MRTVGRLLLAVLPTAILACGGGDGPTEPPPPPPGTTILTAANAADWTVLRSRQASFTNGVFSARAAHANPPSCSTISGYLDVESSGRIDFRPYRTARLTFRVRGRLTDLELFGSVAQLRVQIRPNVPGTPVLDVGRFIVGETPFSSSPTYEESFDVSLANALNYSEATVQVSLSAAPHDVCNEEAWIEVHNLRIEATR